MDLPIQLLLWLAKYREYNLTRIRKELVRWYSQNKYKSGMVNRFQIILILRNQSVHDIKVNSTTEMQKFRSNLLGISYKA